MLEEEDIDAHPQTATSASTYSSIAVCLRIVSIVSVGRSDEGPLGRASVRKAGRA